MACVCFSACLLGLFRWEGVEEGGGKADASHLIRCITLVSWLHPCRSHSQPPPNRKFEHVAYSFSLPPLCPPPGPIAKIERYIEMYNTIPPFVVLVHKLGKYKFIPLFLRRQLETGDGRRGVY